MSNIIQANQVTDLANTVGFDKDMAVLYHQQYCKQATMPEFRDFLQKAKDFECDPRRGEIHFVKFGNNPGETFLGKAGFLKHAVRNPQMDGIEHGVELDEKGKPVYAWTKVYRKDWRFPAEARAYMAEYTRNTKIWKEKPITMLQKVADAQALRTAFPEAFNGVYDISENWLDRDQKTASSGGVDAVVQSVDEKPPVEAEAAPASDELKARFLAKVEDMGYQLATEERELLDKATPDGLLAMYETIQSRTNDAD